jgi:hypothetical protein
MIVAGGAAGELFLLGLYFFGHLLHWLLDGIRSGKSVSDGKSVSVLFP